MSEAVIYELDGHVATITYNRPDALNAINGEMRAGLNAACAIRMPDRVGWSNAMELLLTGERVSADRAREMGLVWKVAADDPMVDARALADRLVAAAPLAARATKEMAHRSRRMGWTEAVRMGETMRKVASATDDAAEGRAAAREGRPPEWKGQ